MTLGDKLSKLRKENNYTQEQLASVLGVSRQAISKWESDVTYPETDKLIKISELFNCSLDYLLKDSLDTDSDIPTETQTNNEIPFSRPLIHERKSEKTVWGMPLWHIGKNAKGIVAVGVNATGVIAVGLKAKGVVSLGLLSLGLLSFGMLSVGVLAIGMFAIGLIAAGCLSLGFFAAGAISLGVISVGAIAVGDFSIGALAIGKYFAMGDNAQAMIALGGTEASGNVFQKIGELTAQEIDTVKGLLDNIVPNYFSWIKEFIKSFI